MKLSMKQLIILLSAFAVFGTACVGKKNRPDTANSGSAPNVLTKKEERAGYQLLYTPGNSEQWVAVGRDRLPAKGWSFDDGMITIDRRPENATDWGGDIVTKDSFDFFDLTFDFRLTERANSGIKYFVRNNGNGRGIVGFEYQVLDDERHPDAKLGRNGNRKTAALYDILPPDENLKKAKPIGEWNTGRVLVERNGRVRHYLNDVCVLDYKLGSEELTKHIQESKFSNQPDFGELAKGPILLQDHNDRVSFRSLKIRRL